MSLKFSLFLFLSFFVLTSCQSITGEFRIVNGRYRCDITTQNLNGFDGFSGVHGFHIDGMRNDDVREVHIIAGTTTIIPRVICDSFRLTEDFIIATNRGIQRFTENALKNCSNLLNFEIRNNPVTEVHENFFYFNVNLNIIVMYNLQVTSLHEAIFGSQSRLNRLAIIFAFSLTDLPPNIFRSLTSLATLRIPENGLTIWRPEWTNTLHNLHQLSIYGCEHIKSVARNSVNARNLRWLWIDVNSLRELDYFMFNDISLVTHLHIKENPIEAIDFNFIDRATSLTNILARSCSCIDRDFSNFHLNRPAFMAELEPCFAAFDRRVLTFSTSSTTPVFNSVRLEKIHLQVQTTSDAIITFFANPDGSGSNFEIQLGINGNTQSCIFQNGVQRACQSTPGILTVNQMQNFVLLWKNEQIFVSHDIRPILFDTRVNAFPVRFYSVGTRGANANWIIEQQAV